jgi:hypothetical protein
LGVKDHGGTREVWEAAWASADGRGGEAAQTLAVSKRGAGGGRRPARMRLGGSTRIHEQDEEAVEAAVGAQEEDWGSGKTTSSWSVAKK